jgi:hypothetical protein
VLKLSVVRAPDVIMLVVVVIEVMLSVVRIVAVLDVKLLAVKVAVLLVWLWPLAMVVDEGKV